MRANCAHCIVNRRNLGGDLTATAAGWQSSKACTAELCASVVTCSGGSSWQCVIHCALQSDTGLTGTKVLGTLLVSFLDAKIGCSAVMSSCLCIAVHHPDLWCPQLCSLHDISSSNLLNCWSDANCKQEMHQLLPDWIEIYWSSKSTSACDHSSFTSSSYLMWVS